VQSSTLVLTNSTAAAWLNTGRGTRLRNLASTPDAVARRCVHGKDTLYCFLPWGKAVYPLWWPSLTKDMQTEQLLCWSGIKDTEHTTSDSNKEEDSTSFEDF